ncbi:MAG: hypothetical protein KDI39_19295 [Pseudomonadales bacterium]|nr:hypothetical protein [Pseudomonadales bacterium]
MKKLLFVSKLLLICESLGLILLSEFALVVAFIQFFKALDGTYILIVFSFSLLYAILSGWITMYWSLTNQPSEGVKLRSYWLVGCIVGCVLFLISLVLSIGYVDDFGHDAKIISVNVLGFPFVLSLLHIYLDYRLQIAANKSQK